MAHIKVTKGLDIPIAGAPEGNVQDLPKPSQVSLNLSPFRRTKFKLLAKAGEQVKLGQALVHDKACPERVWLSPAAGIVREVRRGLKRRLLEIVIDVADQEEQVSYEPVNPDTASPEKIIEAMLRGGLFTQIRQRPFSRLADPATRPRSIFVKACESAPFVPDPALQVEGFEKEFQVGLTALSKLTDGSVHLVHRAGSNCTAFTRAQNVQIHTVEGAHPSSNHSVHIHHIDPINSYKDVVWTVNAHDVVCIGDMLANGRVHTQRVIGIGGPAIHADRRGFFRIRAGYPIGGLIAGRNVKGLVRMISGDVLTGEKVEVDDFIKYHDFCFTAVREETSRELLHFFRPGFGKYSFHRTYASGLLSSSQRDYDMSTTAHGEERAFVDSWVYQEVMPMQIPVAHLVRAVVGADYDAAEELGLLETDAEDFALPAFICPSKIEMVDIIREGLDRYATEALD